MAKNILEIIAQSFDTTFLFSDYKESMMSDQYDDDDHLDDDDDENLNDSEQQKENDELKEMGKHGLTDDDFPDGRPPNTFS